MSSEALLFIAVLFAGVALGGSLVTLAHVLLT